MSSPEELNHSGITDVKFIPATLDEVILAKQELKGRLSLEVSNQEKVVFEIIIHSTNTICFKLI